MPLGKIRPKRTRSEARYMGRSIVLKVGLHWCCLVLAGYGWSVINL